ncbi:hypothetical protein ACFQ48_10555 [Hymenobacter caeli]|uniref:Uncharacterized protein n=1 Tax=Hymenobacter caeli TaxID=2735894 RepID=A0ABX2FTA4_9BACT|nr:hypothetical protein [Hymenobacter caeli]NRT19716.1 hypothetical protein [Hymenobacter caeli]
MTIKELNASKVPIVRIKKSLAKYQEQNPFKEKLVKANEMLREGQIPKHLLPG